MHRRKRITRVLNPIWVAMLIALVLAACIPTSPVGTAVQVVVWQDSVGEITALAIHPKGRLVAAGNSSGSIRIWDSETGQIRTTYQNGPPVTALDYTTDGTKLAATAQDNYVRVWDTTTDQATLVVPFLERPHGIAWNSDGTRMLVAGDDKIVHLVDMARRGKELSSFRGHSAAVLSVAWVPTTRNFLSAGADNKYIYWDSLTGTVLSSFVFPGAGVDVGAHPEGRTLAIGTGAGSVRLYSAGVPNKPGKVFGPGVPLTRIAWNPSGSRIAAASTDNAIRVFDPASGLQAALLIGHTGTPNAVAWLDKDRVISAGADGTIRLWSVGDLRLPPGPPTATHAP